MKFSRVHSSEWIAGFCGAAMLVALFLPWYGDESAMSDFGVLDVFLVLAGAGGLLLPFIVAGSRLTNVPIVSETLVSDLATIAMVILLLKLIWTPEGGLKAGYFLGLIGTFLLTLSGWKSTARES